MRKLINLFYLLNIGVCNLFVIWIKSQTTYFASKVNVESCDQETITVHYFCHPCFGKQVEIVGHLKRNNERYYIITFFENSKVFIPTWMTDPIFCQQLHLEKKPYCSLTALQSLSEYLDCLKSD